MIRLFLPLMLAVLALGCERTDSHPPIIFSVSAEPEIVSPGEPSTITVKAGDADKDALAYQWTASGGDIEGIGKIVTWLSPQAEGKYEITVIVSDGSSSVSQTVNVRVWATRPGDYYPLAIGNKWTFQDNNNNTIVFEIIDVIDISGTRGFVKKVTSSGVEGAENFAYISKGSDGIYQHAAGGFSAGDSTLIFSPKLPLYKLPIITGDSWGTEFSVKLSEGYPVGDGKAEYEVVSEEDLTVKAGSFQHVFQVKEDFTWELFGQELDHTISRQWLAPNAGIIKFSQEQTRGGQTVVTEATLQSYSLK